MGILGQVPSVEKDAGVLAVVELELLGDAHAVRKDTRVVGKVEGAGEKTALL